MAVAVNSSWTVAVQNKKIVPAYRGQADCDLVLHVHQREVRLVLHLRLQPELPSLQSVAHWQYENTENM